VQIIILVALFTDSFACIIKQYIKVEIMRFVILFTSSLAFIIK